MAAVPASRGSALMPARSFSGSIANWGRGSDPEQAGAIGVRDYRAQAGEQVAGLGRVHHVHVLDGERDALLGQFGGQLVAMKVVCGRGRRQSLQRQRDLRCQSRSAVTSSEHSKSFAVRTTTSTGSARHLLALPRRVFLAG